MLSAARHRSLPGGGALSRSPLARPADGGLCIGALPCSAPHMWSCPPSMGPWLVWPAWHSCGCVRRGWEVPPPPMVRLAASVSISTSLRQCSQCVGFRMGVCSLSFPVRLRLRQEGGAGVSPAEPTSFSFPCPCASAQSPLWSCPACSSDSESSDSLLELELSSPKFFCLWKIQHPATVQ